MSRLNEGRSAPIRSAHAVIDFVFIMFMLVLLLCSIYIKMDSDSVYQQSDPKQWVQYKPDYPDDVVSFEELQQKNQDVIGWLTIYGTTIDYPLLQTDNNDFYMNHDARKEVSTGGSLFLDYRNSPDFSDFNTIIHGHHMAHHKMFGDLDLFENKLFFETHEFGDLYYQGKSYGLQVIEFLKADAYDFRIYHPNVTGEENIEKYIRLLREEAMYLNGSTSPVTGRDHIVLLNTCAAGTNERYLLVARILDHTVANTYPEAAPKHYDNGGIDAYTLMNKYGALPIWIWIGIVVLLTLLTFISYRLSRRRDRRKAGNPRKGET